MVVLAQKSQLDPVLLLEGDWNEENVVLKELDHHLEHLIVPTLHFKHRAVLVAEVLGEHVLEIGGVEGEKR